MSSTITTLVAVNHQVLTASIDDNSLLLGRSAEVDIDGVLSEEGSFSKDLDCSRAGISTGTLLKILFSDQVLLLNQFQISVLVMIFFDSHSIFLNDIVEIFHRVIPLEVRRSENADREDQELTK